MGVQADLERLVEDASGCRMCPLWETGTQTVFGEGPPDARLMLVGEQPGDREESRAGRSSVRRAGCSTTRWRGGHRP